MKPFYWTLNGISIFMTCLALLVLSFHFSLPYLAAPIKEFANCEAVSDTMMTYVVIAAISSLLNVIAIIVRGAENSRFAFYSIATTWAPLILLLMWASVLLSAGKLYWQTS